MVFNETTFRNRQEPEARRPEFRERKDPGFDAPLHIKPRAPQPIRPVGAKNEDAGSFLNDETTGQLAHPRFSPPAPKTILEHIGSFIGEPPPARFPTPTEIPEDFLALRTLNPSALSALQDHDAPAPISSDESFDAALELQDHTNPGRAPEREPDVILPAPAQAPVKPAAVGFAGLVQSEIETIERLTGVTSILEQADYGDRLQSLIDRGVEKLRQNNAALVEYVSRLREAYHDIATHCDTLSAQNEALSLERKSFDSQIQEAGTTIATLQDTLEQKDAELAQRDEYTRGLESYIHELKGKVATVAHHTSQISNELEHFDGNISKMAAE